MIRNELESRSRGALDIRLSGPIGITGIVSETVDRFRVVVETDDPEGSPTADWVRSVRLSEGRVVEVVFPEMPGQVFGGVQVNSFGGVIVRGNVSGPIQISGGSVYVNGRRMEPDGDHISSGVRARVEIPSGSSVRAEMDNGSVRLSGDGLISALTAEMSNGRVESSARVGNAVVNASNGRVSLTRMHGPAAVHTSNGRVEIDCYAPGRIFVRAANGRIDVRDMAGLCGSLEVDARAANGRVRVP